MTIKTLLFALFLYVCLVWVGAVYWGHGGPEIQQFGLLWTAVGLIAVLAFIIGARLFGWWRLWRAKAVARPAAPVKSAAPVHEDDVALAALIADANAILAKAPAYAARRDSTPLSGMPLYLLIGPEGSGKTSTFRDSGLEPQLLAGQVAGTAPLVPTRLCNIWLAKDAIFAELSGRAFSGDLSRWTHLLQVLRGGSSVPLWRRLWKEPEQGFVLRGVIGFGDVKEYIGTPNPQLLERRSRDWQQRLLAIGEVFGVEFPVYQIVTKCDAIPFFRDFFRRLPEPEANQVLGCTLPLDGTAAAGAGGVSAEDQAKRLTRSFRPLYHELAKRRITHLAHEPDPSRRPAIYEFPREFKRIRAPLVQFLSDTFRPHPLRPGPQLRGYYLTAVREVEVALADLGESRADWSLPKMGMDATRLFSAADATRIFRPDDVSKGPKTPAGAGLATRWMFVSDLLQSVILSDRPARKAVPVDRRVELYRRGILAAACGLCALLCLAFLGSWVGNHRLLGDLAAVTDSRSQQRGSITIAGLTSLDALRNQVERLTRYDRHGAPWSMRWGLYSGDRLVTYARDAYFRQFQDLLLNKLNQQMVTRLEAVPTTPADGDPYDPIYNDLKTHLMISSGVCTAEPVFVSRVLRGVRQEAGLASGSPEEQALADRQIEFYASELPYGNPCHVTEDTAARDRARLYLQKIKGIDRIYANILAAAGKALTKPQRLGDLASNYSAVLKGPVEPGAAFTPAGWSFVEKASKEGNTAALGEACVIGKTAGPGGAWRQDAQVAKAIQGMFIRDYIAQWRNYLTGFSVARYSGPEDAARKLVILSDHKSPLLALFWMTGNQTNFAAAAEEPGIVEKTVKKTFGKVFQTAKKVEKTADKLTDVQAGAPELSSSDITRTFQPVRWVVPPASDNWIGEKNGSYIDALSHLGQSMQEIAHSGANADPAVHQRANQNYESALDAARQIAKGFSPVGVEGLDGMVEQLLEEPIKYTKDFIITDVDKATVGKVNGELHLLCGQLKGILRKYPFQQSGDDIKLEELASGFAQPAGAIWKFQAQTLADYTVKDGSQWKTKDAAKKPQVTEEMLAFLNRAQEIADVFYPQGANKPHLNFTLRPKLDSRYKDWTVELKIDGQTSQWASSFIQKPFTWPAPSSATDLGAVGRIISPQSIGVPFASEAGLWAVFRIMGDAEPRAPSTKLVEWKNLRTGSGRKEPIDPPVQMEIVEFPGGKDVFNPAFFSLQCPAKAIQ